MKTCARSGPAPDRAANASEALGDTGSSCASNGIFSWIAAARLRRPLSDFASRWNPFRNAASLPSARVYAVARRNSSGESGTPVKSEGASTAGEVSTTPEARMRISEMRVSRVSTCSTLP